MKRCISFILSLFIISIMPFSGAARASDCCETVITAFFHEGDLYITNNNSLILQDRDENYHYCLIYTPDADHYQEESIGSISGYRINIGETKRVATYEELRKIAGKLPAIKVRAVCGEMIVWHDEDSFSNEIYLKFDDERYMGE